MIFKVMAILLLFIMPFTMASPYTEARSYNSKSDQKGDKDNPKYASLVMDADTGRILSQRYGSKKLHPASLTKIMTMLLTFEAIDRGEIRKTTRVRISKHAASMVPSKLGLKPGSYIKVEHAIKILATKSANDIAAALAEHLAGSETRFAKGMTTRARSIGMKNTTFKNASGLPHKDQITTARDMATLARHILKRYPHHYKYFSTRAFSYKGKTYKNHNKLLGTYKGMDGFKTGYINASGYNLVASAQQNGRRLIGVVFGGRSGNSRNAHMATIMDAGFKKVRNSRTASFTQKKPPPTPNAKPTYGVANEKQATPKKITLAKAPKTNAPAIAPANKPQVAKKQTSYASLSALNTSGTSPKITASQGTSSYENGANQIEQGDRSPSASKRIETGLIAVAVHKGDYQPNPAPAGAIENSLREAGHAMVDRMGTNTTQTASNVSTSPTPQAPLQGTPKNISSLPHPKDVVGKWAVQIGAFESRLKTDNALRTAKTRLPTHLQMASPMTVPLNTENGIIFRARLGGLNETQARQACQVFDDCIAVAPIATRLSSR